MRPIASKQSSLRYPLNDVLGTEGQVRLLRVLATEKEHPIAPPEAAERTGLTESGARKALRRLARTGIVERVGSGRTCRYALSRKGGLAERIARLFESEIRSADALLQRIRIAIRRLPQPPRMAWVHRFPEWEGDPMVVGVSHDEEPFGPILRQLKQELVDVQREFDIAIELRFSTQAQLADVDWTHVAPLVGTPLADGPRETESEPEEPGVEGGNGGMDRDGAMEEAGGSVEEASMAPRLNPRSPEFAGALASILNENFSLLRRARAYLDDQLSNRHDGNGHDFWEWRKILDTYPLPRLLNFLQSTSPRAIRLRQCSPFAAVLTDEERAKMGQLVETMH